LRFSSDYGDYTVLLTQGAKEIKLNLGLRWNFSHKDTKALRFSLFA
jgi:hypothetical protein